MLKFLVLFLCFVFTIFFIQIRHAIGQNQQNNSYKILRIIDGDTVVIRADFLPDPLKKTLNLRILGIDTPEKGHRAKCAKERILANKAKRYVTNKIKRSTAVTVEIKKWDKFGGRVLGDVKLDEKYLSEWLIENGYAVSYFGKGEKKDWCL